jgi:hypothetical protein
MVSPEPAIRTTDATEVAERPAAAAFSPSTTREIFGCGASTYQSLSTTPGVRSKMALISEATSVRRPASGP